MPAIATVLKRSNDLEDSLFQVLDPETYELFNDSARLQFALAACEVSMDHARAVRALIGNGLVTPALSLMRPQGESVVRAMWLLYAASDEQIAKLAVPLSREAEKAANKLPMLSDMISALEGKAPANAVAMVLLFKEMHAPALNSFVHGGIHPLQRHMTGYPEPLIVQVVCASNALMTMAGMAMALLSGDAARAKVMSNIQLEFADCLPSLLPHG